MPTIIVFFAVLACLVGGVSPLVGLAKLAREFSWEIGIQALTLRARRASRLALSYAL